jgi:hypothetical protein
MNGNDANRSYTDAVTAQLGERVTNLGRRQTDMETEMHAGNSDLCCSEKCPITHTVNCEERPPRQWSDWYPAKAATSLAPTA